MQAKQQKFSIGYSDIDRYRINGEYRQVTLSPRKLSSKDLPSRIWI